MIRLPSLSPRRVLAGALIALPIMLAGIARPGHTQDSYEGGLWRSTNGGVWCGGGCNRSIHQVCCAIRVEPT